MIYLKTTSIIKKNEKLIFSFLSFVFIAFIWILVVNIVDNELVFPSISSVFKEFGHLFTSKSSYLIILSTLGRLAIAIISSFIIGFVLGICSGISNRFAIFMNPIICILRTIPVAAIILIVLVLIGFTKTPIVICGLMLIPIIYEAVYQGIKTVPTELKDVASLETNSVIDKIRFVYVPLTKNYLKTGLLQSLGLGIKVLIMAEYILQTRNSIGNMLYQAKTNIEYGQVFAWTIILVILALFFELLVRKNKKLS